MTPTESDDDAPYSPLEEALKRAPEYAVPALDKALDIIELLASRQDALSQVEIALSVERSPSQIFRVLSTLERRGYLARDRASGLYSLSYRLFDLTHRQQPVHGLATAALGPMRRLAEALGQSCNLRVLDGDEVRVVAQAESPADFGFRVRVGAAFPLESTATGAVLSAFGPGQSPEADGEGGASEQSEPSERSEPSGSSDSSERIRRDGYLERPDPRQPSITDVVYPVLGHGEVAVAALTIPYVATSFSAATTARVHELASATAREISANLGF